MTERERLPDEAAGEQEHTTQHGEPSGHTRDALERQASAGQEERLSDAQEHERPVNGLEQHIAPPDPCAHPASDLGQDEHAALVAQTQPIKPRLYDTLRLPAVVELTPKREAPHARLPYLPGLDGLRALAVIAVIIFHADLGLRGGFLGVEAFFVLSGFLITSLLLAEWRQDGRVRLTSFWLRRARRLLPALFLVLIGTAAMAAALLPTAEARGLGGDILAALAYMMNWHLIAGGQSYFDPMARPPLLQHLWSLAVEEQFYLLWPLLFIGGMRLLRRRGLLLATLLLAGLSAGLMAALYQPGADPSRIYYGTDTRAGGMLLGAALALVWAPARPPFAERRAAGPVLEVLGALALCGLVAGFVLLHVRHPLLYRGGLSGISLATALAIAAVTHPRTRLLTRVLGWAPLRWIGLRSYGIYLWHWPIFMLTRPRLDVPLSGLPLLALRLTLTLAAAALSYRLVELPIRQGHLRLGARLDGLAARLGWGPLPPRRRQLFARGLGAVALLATAAIVTAGALQLGAPAVSAPAAPVAGQPATPAPGAPPATARPGRALAAPGTPVRGRHFEQDKVQPFDPALAQTLQALLDDLIAQGQIPGVVMSVSIEGREPWLGASGLADLYQGEPMAPDSTVRIASVSKMFTAVAVLQLVEDGRLKLDQPIESLLPGLVPDGDRITVRHLLSHTSGLYDFLEDPEFVNLAYEEPGRVWDPAELVAYANEYGLIFEPGEPGSWDYSSTNYVILGMLVEQVTGNTLAQELRQRIFRPLKLDQTFFLPDEQIDGTPARGYTDGSDQTEVAMSFAFGTGSIASTVDDLQHFATSLFGGKLLKPEIMKQMLTFVDGQGQYDMADLAYGLGVMRHTLPVGPAPDGQERPAELSRALGHIGGFGGFRAALWHAPESGITVAFAVNQTAVDPNTLAASVFDAILTHQGL